MHDTSDRTAASLQDTLVGLNNTLNGAESDLERFYGNADPAAGHQALDTLRDAASTLAELIERLETEVTAAEADDR